LPGENRLKYYNPCPEWDREEVNSSFRLSEAESKLMKGGIRNE
jgi:hypothetical protein